MNNLHILDKLLPRGQAAQRLDPPHEQPTVHILDKLLPRGQAAQRLNPL